MSDLTNTGNKACSKSQSLYTSNSIIDNASSNDESKILRDIKSDQINTDLACDKDNEDWRSKLSYNDEGWNLSPWKEWRLPIL